MAGNRHKDALEPRLAVGGYHPWDQFDPVEHPKLFLQSLPRSKSIVFKLYSHCEKEAFCRSLYEADKYLDELFYIASTCMRGPNRRGPNKFQYLPDYDGATTALSRHLEQAANTILETCGSTSCDQARNLLTLNLLPSLWKVQRITTFLFLTSMRFQLTEEGWNQPVADSFPPEGVTYDIDDGIPPLDESTGSDSADESRGCPKPDQSRGSGSDRETDSGGEGLESQNEDRRRGSGSDRESDCVESQSGESHNFDECTGSDSAGESRGRPSSGCSRGSDSDRETDSGSEGLHSQSGDGGIGSGGNGESVQSNSSGIMEILGGAGSDPGHNDPKYILQVGNHALWRCFLLYSATSREQWDLFMEEVFDSLCSMCRLITCVVSSEGGGANPFQTHDAQSYGSGTSNRRKSCLGGTNLR